MVRATPLLLSLYLHRAPARCRAVLYRNAATRHTFLPLAGIVRPYYAFHLLQYITTSYHLAGVIFKTVVPDFSLGSSQERKSEATRGSIKGSVVYRHSISIARRALGVVAQTHAPFAPINKRESCLAGSRVQLSQDTMKLVQVGPYNSGREVGTIKLLIELGRNGSTRDYGSHASALYWIKAIIEEMESGSGWGKLWLDFASTEEIRQVASSHKADSHKLGKQLYKL